MIKPVWFRSVPPVQRDEARFQRVLTSLMIRAPVSREDRIWLAIRISFRDTFGTSGALLDKFIAAYRDSIDD